ncbi:hypothetical protein HMPREF1544_08243 [Mucor circinelloides 1006PhL]|uniref:Uncharacterized protein n=1 Tax=Mucor circinelloides f. circinelloides (strain 1006PhL) TaxID=1220926 RepID=S2JYS5_MUCC1|nr:hypothetical protein HMPREF1544_08243 [Mucor circinelloides 1006PhL]
MYSTRTQATCLKMTLNQSERHNVPSMVLNMMGALPTMYTRAQILTFKFWYSLQLKAHPFTLIECILYTTHQHLKIAPALWRRLSFNKIWKLYKSSSTPTTARLMCEEFQDAQMLKWTTQKSSCLRALREDTSGYDPLLLYPCTRRLERSRLIRWRFHHLPSFPLSACRFGGAPSVNRFHYLATCPLVQGIFNRIHLNLPDNFISLDESYDDHGVAASHILDCILNSLPTTLSFYLGTHWKRIWPLVLDLITQIDIANHPLGSFAEEPPPGELFEHYLNQQ